MHISDGVLPWQTLTLTWAITLPLLGVSSARLTPESIPKVALMSAAFFVASLIHVPIGVSSTHLILNGFIGILLGMNAFLAIFLGLLMQTFLFGFGGLSSLGANACLMGLPAILAGWLYSRLTQHSSRIQSMIWAGILAGLAISFSTLIASLLLLTAGKSFQNLIILLVLGHFPVMLIEGVIAALITGFLYQVKPEMLK